MNKLKVLPLALAMGVTWGLGIILLGWIAGSGWRAKAVEVFGNAYPGYAASFLGGLIGGLWAFIDAFVGGLVFAVVYNAFAARSGAEKAPLSIRTEQPAH